MLIQEGIMNKQPKYNLTPSVFDEGFFPSFLRQLSLFDDENMAPMRSNDRSNLSLSEDDNNVYVEAHLPGVKEEDIDLTQDKGILWIKGDAKEVEEDAKRKFYHKATRSFSYRIAIPGNIDETKEATALYENGVIKITYPKLGIETPKKIQITSKS